MWLNSGRFLDNGRCGYILKPSVMLTEGFNPFDHGTYAHGSCGVTLRIRVRYTVLFHTITQWLQILSGRHLIKSLRGVASPLVEVELCGTENDSQRFKVMLNLLFIPTH